MKKIDLIAIILGVALVITSAIVILNKDHYNDGLCDECRGYMEEVGTVFPYAQYRCVDCGHYKLCNN